MTTQTSRSHSSDTATTACFSVHAAADPGIMPRVMGVFAKRGLVPSIWYSSLTGPQHEDLQIDVQVRDMSFADQSRIADALRRIVGVEVVLTAEKRLAATA